MSPGLFRHTYAASRLVSMYSCTQKPAAAPPGNVFGGGGSSHLSGRGGGGEGGGRPLHVALHIRGACDSLAELAVLELHLEGVELLQGQRLRDGNGVVCEIVLGGARVAGCGEAAREGFDGAKEKALALVQNNRLRERVEDLRRGLVDGAEDVASLGQAELDELPADVLRREAVEARGRLVEEDELGLHHELNADGGALLLAAADPANHLIAAKGVGAVQQAEVGEHLLDQLTLFGHGHRARQA